MNVSTRKKDLENKLQMLVRELSTTVEMVDLVRKSCEEIVADVCNTDRCTFLSRYPSVIQYLDARIHHLLQFNVEIDSLLSLGLNVDNSTNDAYADSNTNDKHILADVMNSVVDHCQLNSHVEQPLNLKGTGNTLTQCAGAEEVCVANPAQGLCVANPAKGVCVANPAKGVNVASPAKGLCVDNPAEGVHVSDPALGEYEDSSPKPSSCDSSIRPEALFIEQKKTTPKSSNTYTKKAINERPVTLGSEENTESCKPKFAHSDKLANIHPINTQIVHSFVKSQSDEILLNQTASKVCNEVNTNVTTFPRSVRRPVHIGDERIVMISHVESPGDFYVHIVCEENTSLDKFQEDLNTFYGHHKVKLKSKAIAKTRIGNFCVCFQPEIGWCRAQVLNWCLDEQLIEVQLVDYGDLCYCYLEMIQPILPEYIKQPLYVTRCHLAFIEPPPMFDTWPLESTKVFNCYMPSKDDTRAQLASSIEMNDTNTHNIYNIIMAEPEDIVHYSYVEKKLVHETSISVILRDSSCSEKLNMNDNLVDLGYAKLSASIEEADAALNISNRSIITEEHKLTEADKMNNVEHFILNSFHQHSAMDNGNHNNDCNTDVMKNNDNAVFQGWDPMQEDYFDPTVGDENALLAVSGYEPQDGKRLCKHFARNGYCYKGIYCRMEHEHVNPDCFTTDKELIYTSAFSALNMPQKGSTILVSVTHVPHDKHYFYCIFPLNIDSTKLEETLETLSKSINEPKTLKQCLHLQIPAALGQIVLAYSNLDSSWHRARIIQELDDNNDTIDVFLVDSGRTETIHVRNIRAIDPSMLHLPFQAVELRLANVQIENISSACQYLKDFCLGKIFTAKVVRSFECVQSMYIHLLDPLGNDVGLSLIHAGFGVEGMQVYHSKYIPG